MAPPTVPPIAPKSKLVINMTMTAICNCDKGGVGVFGIGIISKIKKIWDTPRKNGALRRPARAPAFTASPILP